MRNAGLEEAQAGIKIARRNINNLRYAVDNMAKKGQKHKKWTAEEKYKIIKPALDRKSTRLNSSHTDSSRMPSSA